MNRNLDQRRRRHLTGSVTMAESQIIQGSWEDIVARADEFRGRDDLMLIVPATSQHIGDRATQSLADAMKDYIGSVHLGDANLSENTGQKFANLLAENY